ncbi:armadillo-type protein [Cytidiella melzeri]|nr:armadillo-type protein [Cytidiella melzeri]
MVVQTRGGGQGSPKKLKFHDKLLGGKNLTTDALQKKLKALHSELAEMDQETVEADSLGSVLKELISTSILLHKDRGVKAYAACCLADLLRLYAPDAPYTQDELRDIFQFFFRQLSQGLKGADSPYYNEYFHLLESLSTVKSVVLVCDLPNADELMAEIFRGFFGMVRLDLAKKIELFMSDILIALLDECQSLPNEVLETLMAQYMDKNARMDQPAYRLAVQVCNATADKLQRHVCQYFTDIIVTHARDEELDEIRTAHELIKRINRSSPALLHNVVPQLEEELRVQEVAIRVMATQTLGEMFAEKNGAEFARKYPSTWTTWLARKNDQVTAVRLAFVESTKGVLVNMTLTEQREQIEEVLQAKLLDPDEKIRAAVCRLYTQIDYETALHHVSEQQLRNLAGRGLDKKASVQVEAMKAIARLYHLAYPEIENNDPAALQQFSWIPQSILTMSTASSDVKALAEQMIADYILPLPAASSSSGKTAEVDEVAWTERLLCTMKFLDETANNSLRSLSGIRAVRPTVYERYLQACIDNNGGVIDEDEENVVNNLTMTIKRVAGLYPDPQRATEDLSEFAKMNEGRLFKLLKTCMDPQTDIKTLVKSSNEFFRRLEQSSSSTVSTMTTFTRRATLHVVNQSSIPTLLKRMQKGSEGGVHAQVAQHAQLWLVYISKHNPAMYKLHVAELTKAIADEKSTDLVEVSLQALAGVAEWDEKLAPHDKRTLERLQRFTRESSYRHAKFAARLLACTKNHEEICARVVEFIADSLSTEDSEQLTTDLSVLAQLVIKSPDAFERKSDVIMKFLLKQVIMAESVLDKDAMNTDEEWVEDNQMTPQLQCKLLALKVCRKRCLAHANSDHAMDIAKPVLRMLMTLLQHSGSFSEDAVDDPKAKARLRLQAATSLLHLATMKKFADNIGPSFALLALEIQDPCYHVRLMFIMKLVALLTARKLPTAYNVILFLVIHDPEADVINRAKAYVTHVLRSMPKQMRLDTFEMIFIRLLHLLAHHPDFAITEDALPDIAKYIDFYLDLVCTPENIALLYHLAMKTKTIRDAESHAHTENLYAVGELAQHLIKARAKSHSWPLESYPGKIRIPGDIFRPLPSVEAANEVLKTIYLPEAVLSWLAEKQTRGPVDKEKQKAERRAPAKRKAPVPKANGHLKKPRVSAKRRKGKVSDDEDESSESEEDSGSDDEIKPQGSPEILEEEKEESNKTEERPGRSARTRAQALIKQQTRKSASKR